MQHSQRIARVLTNLNAEDSDCKWIRDRKYYYLYLQRMGDKTAKERAVADWLEMIEK